MMDSRIAAGILNACAAKDAPSHALSSATVESLLAWADNHKYRAPKNANGSRARYWHAYLTRRAAHKIERAMI